MKNHITQFLEHLEISRNLSQKTIENYHHYLGRFREFAGEITPEKISIELLHSYRIFLSRSKGPEGDTLDIKTQNYHIIALRAFLKYLIKNNISTLPPEKIELSKIPERSIEYLDREELEHILQSIGSKTPKALRDKAIMETLYSTGLRISELVSLNRSQINLDRGEFMVRGKGRKPRIVFLSPRAITHLTNYLATRKDQLEPLFINYGRSRRLIPGKAEEAKRLTAWTIQDIIRNTARKAGIVKKVTPHIIRHSYATELLINGADIRSVQEMLGHASITTTQVYTHITNKKLREVHQKFHK